MRRRRGLLAVAVTLVALLATASALPAAAGPADSPGSPPLGASRIGLPSDAPAWFTMADLRDGVPTAALLAAVGAGLPADPITATTELVATIFGTDRDAAIAATGEVMRRAGLPLVSALGPIVAMPDGDAIVNAPIQVELLPMLTDSIRGGVFWTAEQVGQMLQYAGVTTTAFTGAQVVGILDEWGKDTADPTESVIAGTAVRALAAQRHQLLIPSMVVDTEIQQAVTTDPSSLTDQQLAELTAPARLIGLDPLQGILLLAHAAARTPSQLSAAPGNGLRRPSAVVDGPCPDLSSEGAAAGKALGKSKLQNAIGNAAARKWGEAAKKNFDKGGEALDKAEEVISTALLVLGAHLDLESDKDSTHFRHESGDTSRNVHLTATASFHSPLGGEALSCWAFAGIDVPQDGPLDGYKIRWRIDGGPAVLDVVGKDATKVQDGETTGSDGRSTLETYPMTEKNPPKPGEDEPEQTVPQTVVASLSKDDFPFHLKDLVGITEGGPYAAAAKQLVNVMEGMTKKVGLPSESRVIQVTYHGVNPYVAKGDSSLDVLLAKVTLHADMYSCNGPDGPWKGTAGIGGDLAKVYSIFGLPTSGALSGSVNFSLNSKNSSPQTFDVKPKLQVQITLDPDAVENAEHPPQGAGGSDRILGGAVIGTGTWVVNGENWADDATSLGPLVPTPEFQVKTVRHDSRCPGSTLDDDFFDPYG